MKPKKKSLVMYVPTGYKKIFGSKYSGFMHAVKKPTEYWKIPVRITIEELE